MQLYQYSQSIANLLFPAWNTAGVAAVYPFEAITETSNPAYHNAFDLDTAEGFSYEHLVQFSELLLGYFYHLTS